jgi:hypothetical protein
MSTSVEFLHVATGLTGQAQDILQELRDRIHASETEQQRTSQELHKHLKQTLRATLDINEDATMERERVSIKAPAVAQCIAQYEQELRDIQTSSYQHSTLALLQNTGQIPEESSNHDQIRRLTPALLNNLYTVEELFQEAFKNGLQKPRATIEENPAEWLTTLDELTEMMKQPEHHPSLLEKFSGNYNKLHKISRTIQLRTREGLPTMLQHLRNSLELHIRLRQQPAARTTQHNPSVDPARANQRLQNLMQMGYSGYILARLSEEHIPELLRAIPTNFGGFTLLNLKNTTIQIQERTVRYQTLYTMAQAWASYARGLEQRFGTTLSAIEYQMCVRKLQELKKAISMYYQDIQPNLNVIEAHHLQLAQDLHQAIISSVRPSASKAA